MEPGSFYPLMLAGKNLRIGSILTGLFYADLSGNVLIFFVPQPCLTTRFHFQTKLMKYFKGNFLLCFGGFPHS